MPHLYARRSYLRLSKKMLVFRKLQVEAGAGEMTHILSSLLIVIALALTGYFGLAAWRSGEDQIVAGTIWSRSR
jgi:hypothetical protein